MPDNKDLLSLKDEILVSFRQIHELFKIMDTTSVEIYGELSRSYSEVGVALCNNFRSKLDHILQKYDKEQDICNEN